MTEWIAARNVAKLLGVQTGTLRKWRSTGYGPKNHVRIKGNLVVYPKDEVEKFRESLKEILSAEYGWRPRVE